MKGDGVHAQLAGHYKCQDPTGLLCTKLILVGMGEWRGWEVGGLGKALPTAVQEGQHASPHLLCSVLTQHVKGFLVTIQLHL